MRQHVFAFLVALAVWCSLNLVGISPAQQLSDEVCIRPAASTPAPSARTIVTDDARCVQSTECEAWYLFSCSGHLPDCNGGCWVTGYFPCSVCYQDPGQTCVQEQVTLNVGLWSPDCTSSSGYYCDACAGNYTRVSDYYVTTLRCR